MVGRATKMRDKLNEMGFNMVKAYTGSMTEWINKGGEIENNSEKTQLLIMIK